MTGVLVSCSTREPQRRGVSFAVVGVVFVVVTLRQQQRRKIVGAWVETRGVLCEREQKKKTQAGDRIRERDRWRETKRGGRIFRANLQVFFENLLFINHMISRRHPVFCIIGARRHGARTRQRFGRGRERTRGNNFLKHTRTLAQLSAIRWYCCMLFCLPSLLCFFNQRLGFLKLCKNVIVGKTTKDLRRSTKKRGGTGAVLYLFLKNTQRIFAGPHLLYRLCIICTSCQYVSMMPAQAHMTCC